MSSQQQGARQGPIAHEHLNPRILETQYAVRGEVVVAAGRLKDAVQKGQAKHGVKEVVFCNLGNPQALGQRPLTFFRQVLAACTLPSLAEAPNDFVPEDARARARRILASTDSNSIGAYSHSQGLMAIREEVASFLEQRDGMAADPNKIFLCGGASAGIAKVLNLLIAHPKVGVLIPIPQYPLYSASLTMLGATQLPYHLCEERGWGLDINDVRATVEKAKRDGVDPRVLVVINPGNPTGQCLSEDNMRELVALCVEHHIVLLADEVYQVNVYDNKAKFVSFRKVKHDMGKAAESLMLISFHSTSKGLLGECGMRGGFYELHGMAESVYEQLYKVASISLCPNLPGQVMTSLMVNPPREGDESFELYKRETTALFASLQRRADLTSKLLNSVEGISCQPVSGAMYAFPKISLPEKAVEAARAAGKAPDLFFALELLEHTGMCVVPGSGFGQEDGTFHFRTTILPPEDAMESVMHKLVDFYREFVRRYSSRSLL